MSDGKKAFVRLVLVLSTATLSGCGGDSAFREGVNEAQSDAVEFNRGVKGAQGSIDERRAEAEQNRQIMGG